MSSFFTLFFFFSIYMFTYIFCYGKLCNVTPRISWRYHEFLNIIITFWLHYSQNEGSYRIFYESRPNDSTLFRLSLITFTITILHLQAIRARWHSSVSGDNISLSFRIGIFTFKLLNLFGCWMEDSFVPPLVFFFFFNIKLKFG